MVKASLIYLFSSLFGKSVPFLLLPLLTSYLSPVEFGLVAIIQLSIQFSQAASGLCLNVNIPKKYFSQTKDERAILIFNLYLILFFSCFIFFGALVILSLSFQDIFGIPERWLLIMPVLAFMAMSNLINLTLIRTREKPFLFMSFEVSQAALNLFLTIYFVVFLNMSWEGRALAIAFSVLVFGIVAVVSLVKQGYLKVLIDTKVVRETLKVSVPLIPHAIAGVIITVSDRLFIEEMIGLKEVGIYSVGYYFGMVVMLFSDAFIKAWSPWFFKKMSRGDSDDKRLIVKYTYVYVIALIVGAMIYSSVAVWLLPFVVTEQYLPAVNYIPWICVGYIAFGIYQIFFPYLVYCEKTQYVAVATVLAACINLIGNYYLIDLYGAVGAAYATIVAFSLSAFIVAWYSKTLVSMPWKL
ncbi:MAG: hypothetical protein COB77_04865 [Gammaproteobacteria bacterium]|nr:MAG: hypothetical protein COB77_04865 [Gammaproteobacteria bacterium]